MYLKRTMVLAIAAVAGCTGALVSIAPAYAVPGLQYVTTSSAMNSTSPKSLALVCPSGRVPINGGAYLTGAIGNATLRQIVPLQIFGAPFLSVVAEEDADGYAGSWSVTATAVCIPTPAGFSFVSASGSDPSSAWVTASCGSKHIIGSGYIVSPTASMMAAGAEIDSRNRAYLSVEWSQVPGSATPVTGTAVAVCADAPLPGLRQLSTTSPVDSINGKTATTVCPTGTQVVGIGGDLWWLRHYTVIDDFAIYPAANSTSVTGYENELGNPDGWGIDTYALCAT